MRWWWWWWQRRERGGEAHVRVDWMLPGVQALIHAGLVGGDESSTMRGVYLGQG